MYSQLNLGSLAAELTVYPSHHTSSKSQTPSLCSSLVHMESLKTCLRCAKDLVGIFPCFIPKARTVPRAEQAH